VTPLVVSHRAKTQNLADLCKTTASNTSIDSEIQSQLAKGLVLMAAAYIEISLREVVADYCKARSTPSIAKFVSDTISWENSLDCRNIKKILNRLNDTIWTELETKMGDPGVLAIGSLKALRDNIAHGKDNGTGYLVVSQYFKNIIQFPEHLKSIMSGL
jgi:hypothetical protein